MIYNPSLREEPIDQPAAVIPIKQETSILDWLEATGRLLARAEDDAEGYLDEDEEIDQLMGGDDIVYDEDIDDDDDIVDDID